jgi:predicted alpha/beta-hydrolase family hydrolase
MAKAKQLRFEAEPGREVSALLHMPPKPKYLLVLGHGAGAGMNHPFMANLADALAAVDVASLRYQFPYMEEGRHVPDRPPVLTATVAAAVRAASKAAPQLPILAGGKSMGGRMTSQAAAQGLLPGVRGLILFGFPLHQPNRPDTKRADHLADVKIPMLFLQGTRDSLADLKLLRPLIKKLGARATLHIIDTADHSFHVLKSASKTDAEVLQELAKTAASWMSANASRSS